MGRALYRLAVAGLTLYLLAAVAMFFLQRDLQYFPTQYAPNPVDLGLADVAVEQLATPDGETLILWHAPAPNGQPTVLLLHGNAGEIANRTNRLTAFRDAGYGVAFLSYRGFGGSTGTPTEAGLLIDANTAYDFLMAQGVTPDHLVVIGESLGTGVAVQLAASRPTGAVILEAPYSAAVDIAADQYPWLPVHLLMHDQFVSRAHIGDITVPLLILHGTADRVIPLASGEALFAAARDTATFIPVEGAGHGALFDGTLWPLEFDFLATVYAR